MTEPPITRPTLAIAAPVRGEAAYLVEWIAWHRVMGIDAFILADNGGDDGTSAVLATLAGQDTGVIVLDWRGARQMQLPFYVQALGVARRFAHGLFLVDCDEFLRPQGERATAREAAEAWLADSGVGAVALNWALYGSSGRQEAGEGLVPERFTRRAEQRYLTNYHSKPFVRVAACSGPGDNPHYVKLDGGRYISPDGRDVVWDTARVKQGITAEVCWEGLRVDHFVLKSREEFERKRARGSATSASVEQARFRDSYFTLHDRNDVEDPVPPAHLAALRREIDRLLAHCRTKLRSA